jgi:transcription elongation factor/antiterminator RfaH
MDQSAARAKVSPNTGAGVAERCARWFVAYTERRGEALAIDNLRRQGFGAFCPWIHRTIRHARKTKTVLAPLFPSYVFVELDPTQDRWRSINGTRGVSHLIANGETPTPLPLGVVEAIRARTGDDDVVDWTASFHVGQTVRISSGPFAELVGTLEHLPPEGRVRVLVHLMGQAVAVQMHRNDLEPG